MLREDTRALRPLSASLSLSLSRSSARYPGGGFAVDKRGEKAASLGKSEKDALQLAKMSFPATPSSSALFTQPLATVARVRASSRLSLVFRRSNTRRIGSTGSTSDDGEDGESGIRVSAEEANASRCNALAPSPR